MRINYQLFKLFGGCFFQIPSRKKKRETNDMLCDLLYKVFNFVSIKKFQKILKKLYIYIQSTLVISNSMGPWKTFESTVVRLKRSY